MNAFYLRQRRRLLPWLALLLLTVLVGYRQVAAQFGAAAPELVAGSYAGTVLVSEPAPLGDLDLLLDIISVNGQLTGQVNPAKTQVFLGGPTFTGTVMASPGITPTLRIESQTFASVVSGRTVQRHFVLTGEVLAEGNELRGVYTETISGFKPHPMQVKGTFLLMRPNGVTAIITVPTPRGTPPIATPITPGQGGTPMPTPTPTVPLANSNGSKLYLPLVQRAAAANVAASEENMADDMPTIMPTETPTVTETPTPTPLVLDASTVLTTATEAQHQIHLPLIMR
ncbi:MAG: hypothetical protein NT075_22915 [Chloroflexi bacterium]|nr:hypothetical protein [Chloroflexota bacterium]